MFLFSKIKTENRNPALWKGKGEHREVSSYEIEKKEKKKASKAGNGKHEMLSNRLLNRSSSYFKPTHCWKMKFVAPALTNSFGCVVGIF